jgi:hypothetical protein
VQSAEQSLHPEQSDVKKKNFTSRDELPTIVVK